MAGWLAGLLSTKSTTQNKRRSVMMMQGLLLSTAVLLATSAPAPGNLATWRLRVGLCTEQRLTGAGFDDVWPVHGGPNRSTFDVYIDHARLAQSERQLAAMAGCDIVEKLQGRPGREVLVPDGYRHPDEMFELFRLLADEHPGRAEILDLTEELGTPLTVEGRRIYAMKDSDNVHEDEDEPNLLLVGMHHAREIIAPETVLIVARNLLEGDDHRTRSLVNDNQIYLAWDWNPDGYRYVFDVDNNWRKNRLPNPDGSFGVDLNRNYPFGASAELFLK